MSTDFSSKNIYVDTNIIIGAFLKHQQDVKCLQHLYSLRDKKLYLSSLSVAQFAAKMEQHKNNKTAIREYIQHLLSHFYIIKFEQGDIENALAMEQPDLEDNMQYAMGRKLKCLYFVTNNVKDYRNFYSIRVISANDVRLIEE